MDVEDEDDDDDDALCFAIFACLFAMLASIRPVSTSICFWLFRYFHPCS